MHVQTREWLAGPTSWLELSRAALAHNLEGIRRLVGPAQIMAVVKANAYGAGATGMAQALAAAGVRRFGVATVAEAVRLRQAGIAGQIVCLAWFTRPEVPALFEHELIPAVFDLAAGRLLDAHARATGRRLAVWVKIDTGLSRLGVPVAAATDFLRQILALPGLRVAGLFSTLTEHPDRDPIQTQRLLAVRRAMPELAHVSLSLASSHGIVSLPASYLDIVRPGILLHGLEPSERSRLDEILLDRVDPRPIACWRARVVDTRIVAAGEQIGYGLRPPVAIPTTLATLGVGWADGYPPAMSQGGTVLISSQRCPVVAVSANCTIVDVSQIRRPPVIGDVAVLLGEQDAETITAAEMVHVAGSNVYRLLAAVPESVARIWH